MQQRFIKKILDLAPLYFFYAEGFIKKIKGAGRGGKREEHRTSTSYKSAAAFGKRYLKLANRTTVRALAKPRGELQE